MDEHTTYRDHGRLIITGHDTNRTQKRVRAATLTRFSCHIFQFLCDSILSHSESHTFGQGLDAVNLFLAADKEP